MWTRRCGNYPELAIKNVSRGPKTQSGREELVFCHHTVSVGEFDFAALKNFNFKLEINHCQPTDGYSNTLYIYTPAAFQKKSLEEQKAEENEWWDRWSYRKGGVWAKYENIDMCGQGDVETIPDWRSKMSFEELLQKVEEKNWSAISIGEFGFAAIKSLRYQLSPSHCKPSEGYKNTLYIYTRPPGSVPVGTTCVCSIA